MKDSRLTLENVTFAYAENGWALHVPHLELGAERITCIVGPNGSGKSSLLRLAAGLLPPHSGTLSLAGTPLSGLSRRRIARDIGFLPQESPPLFDFTVESVVCMGRYAHVHAMGLLTENDNQAVDAALRAVALTGFRDRELSHLSGGERRRALIASVLAQQPRLMLLDEPTSSLDIQHAGALMRVLSGFKDDGPAVVVVTHDINLAALFADRLLLLVDGSIRADGSVAEVVTESVLQAAYGRDLLVREHPESGGPMVVVRR